MDKNPILIGTIILFGLVSFSFCLFSTGAGGWRFDLIENVGKEGFQDLFLGPGQRFSLESPDFLLVEKNSLISFAPPTTINPQVFGALVGEYETEDIK